MGAMARGPRSLAAMPRGLQPRFLGDSELDRNLEALREEVWRARVCWEAWWVMKGRRYRGKYHSVFEQYSDYFKVAIHSHFTALVMAIWRLHDSDPPGISLQTITGRIGPRPDIAQETLQQYRGRIRSIRPLVVGLETIRHKFLAHRDPAYTVERAFREANLKYRDLRRVVDNSLDLVNILLRARRLGSLSFDNSITADTVRVIRRLHR